MINHPEIGVCGISCRLCPIYHTEAKSRCGGCKSEARMAVGCSFITCAVKEKGIEFCWDCEENQTCDKWAKRRESGKHHDSFKCYQTLEDDISFIRENGVEAFKNTQMIRERLLKSMLKDFNEGRSRSYYCIVATVMQIDELKEALSKAKKKSKGLNIKNKSKVLHAVLNEIAGDNGYNLKLRK